MTGCLLGRWRWPAEARKIAPLAARRNQAFVFEENDHLRTVPRYVERNPARAGLARRPEDWPWSSLPVWRPLPQAPLTEVALAALRRSVERGAPYGSPAWTERTGAQLGLESSLHPPGRQRKRATSEGAPGGQIPSLDP